MPDDIDKILNDIEAEKQAKIHKEDTERQLFTVDEQTAKKLSEERKTRCPNLSCSSILMMK